MSHMLVMGSSFVGWGYHDPLLTKEQDSRARLSENLKP